LKNAAGILQGASITDELVYRFHRQLHTFHYNPFFERLEGRDEYQVCLKVVNIHLNEEQALATDLFGTTGEEVIQCIDAYSIEKSGYQALSLEVLEEDVEAREAFTTSGIA